MHELVRLTGGFRDRASEREFRASILPSVQQDSLLALVVAAALTAMFAVSDYNFMGMTPAFYKLLGVRAVMVAGCLVMAVCLRRSNALVDRPWLYSLAPFLIGSGVLLILYLRPISAPTILTSTVIVVMAFYLFVPNLVMGMVASSLYLSVGFIFGAWLWAGYGLVSATSMSLLLLMGNIVGYFVALRLAKLQRSHFISLKEERRARQLLATEVEHREILEGQLRVMAQTDALTGLSNRRHFMECAQEALIKARREGQPFSVCMIDIDHFKKVNDGWGHGGGDAVLVTVAKAFAETLRHPNLLGRFGGEEFVAALPGTDQQGAERVAERLRRRIEALRFDAELAPVRITITVGIAQIRAGEHHIDAALGRADAALYQGKRAGRNRTTVTGMAV